MKQLVISVFLLLVISSCKEERRETTTKVSKKTEEDREISSAEKEGFDKAKLEEVLANASENNPKLDGLLIAKNGKLIAEEYFNGYTAEKPHKVWSITKMVTGTALGIAVDKGLLSEKDSIYTHLGEYATESLAATGITIENLITMTSGIQWQEMGGRESAGFKLPYSNNWIEFVLQQPKSHEPGKVFNYSTGNSLLLEPILKNATGKQVDEFTNENLFKPLGIKNYTWYKQSEFWTKQQGGEIPNVQKPDITYTEPFASLTNTGSGLLMLPRDMCKLGQLYLNKGKWNGKQVMSENWVEASTTPHFNNSEYGYHWRLGNFEGYPYYFATGFGLQRIFVFPTLEMIVVTTQSHYTTMPNGNKLTNELLKNIVNSVKE